MACSDPVSKVTIVWVKLSDAPERLSIMAVQGVQAAVCSRLGVRVMDSITTPIGDNGHTAVAILAESSMSIHTYLEHALVCVEFFANIVQSPCEVGDTVIDAFNAVKLPATLVSVQAFECGP